MNAEWGSGKDPGGPRRGARAVLALALIALVVAGLGNAVVWYPLWRHYHVEVAVADSQVMQTHKTHPSREVLRVVADVAMMTDHPLRGEAAVVAARRILRGELALPSLPVLPVHLDFSSDDLEEGVPVQRLFVASLIVPELLLRAYEHTPDPAFFAAARRYLRGFIRYEAKVQFPDGFVFDDHAVANRAAVLIHYWSYLRSGSEYDESSAREVHRHAARLAAFLSKPSMFIASTNHGVMQNLALMQLAVAFPALPGASGLWDLAVSRLRLQLPAYIGPEGEVLEHSAGYHFHGVVLTGYVVLMFQAAGLPVPVDWKRAHESSRRFLETLQRPDRTLPSLGNTYRYAWTLPARLGGEVVDFESLQLARPAFTRTFPTSGLAVWWEPSGSLGIPVQTVVPWGYFPEHGHRRAQELSLLIWADGTDWSMNTGYWPRDDEAGFETANGWDGGNAPHVIGESAKAKRRSAVLAQGEADDVRFLDLERVVAGGPRVRRQILQWRGNTWLTLDTYIDAEQRPLRVLWTAASETKLLAGSDLTFRFQRPGALADFTMAVAGNEGLTATPLKGSLTPFGGWSAKDRKAVPAPAIDVRLAKPGGWLLTTLHLSKADPVAGGKVTHFGSPEDWRLELKLPGGELQFQRRGNDLTVMNGARPRDARQVVLTSGPDPRQQLAAIERAGDSLRAAYPRYRTGEWERRRYSLALNLLWLGLSLMTVLYWAWPMARRSVQRRKMLP